MKKVLKNLIVVEVKSDLNEYHFKSIDGTLVISIKDYNIFHFSYLFNDIIISNEALYGSSFISENFISNKTLNLVKDAPLIDKKDFYIITIKSKLRIIVDKRTAQISIYKAGYLIHGGKFSNENTQASSNQLKVLKAKGDASFISKFTFGIKADDEFYGISDKALFLIKNLSGCENYYQNSTLKNSSFKSNAFFIKRKKGDGICGLFFDQCSIDEISFGVENFLHHSITAHNSPSSYYFFDGSNYKDILEAYYSVIGRPCFPPLYTFGCLGSLNNLVNEEVLPDRILEFFMKTEEYKIPCEGLYLSSCRLKNSDAGQYPITWKTDEVTHNIDYVKALLKRGYHLSINIKPKMLLNHSYYEELDRKGYFIRDECGNSYVDSNNLKDVCYIDFTNKKSYSWWKNKLKEQLINNEISGIWYDCNEFEIEDPGVSLKKIKSILPLLMIKASNEAFEAAFGKSAMKRPWITSRSDYSGCLLNENFGDSYNKDLTNELLIRAIENEVLKTSLVIHSLLEDSVSYLAVLPIIVNLIKMHYAFMPYIYNAAYEALSIGLSLDRPLCLEFEDERIDLNTTDSLFGNSILKVLVADEGITQREVYLPKDCHWYNAVNKKFYYGGANVVVNSSPGIFNYFVKEGSIIELNRDNDKKLSTGLYKNLDLKIYRIRDDKTCVSYYFEDDGETHLDENKFNIYKFELTKRRFIITKTKCSIKKHGRLFNVCNEIGSRISSFDPDKLEEGESISYKL